MHRWGFFLSELNPRTRLRHETSRARSAGGGLLPERRVPDVGEPRALLELPGAHHPVDHRVQVIGAPEPLELPAEQGIAVPEIRAGCGSGDMPAPLRFGGLEVLAAAAAEYPDRPLAELDPGRSPKRIACRQLVALAAFDLEMEETRDCLGGQGREVCALRELIVLIDQRDSGLASHSELVRGYAAATAEEVGLAPEQVRRVALAGLVHDLGKVTLPDAILAKPGL